MRLFPNYFGIFLFLLLLLTDQLNRGLDGWWHFLAGEQGALTMMPLFLIDQKIDATEVSFWTGIVCQGISIGGSILGGWLVTNFKYVVCLLF